MRSLQRLTAPFRLSVSRSPSSTRSVLLGALVLLFACASAACGARAVPPQVAPPPVKERPSAGRLVALLPPGPELVLLARPADLMHEESARTLWRTLVAEDREQAFVARTGVDPRTVDELVVIAVGSDGYLLLARGAFDADAIVLAAGDRLAVPDVVGDDPIVRREGLAGAGRYAYASLDEHAIMVAKDAEPALVAAVLARLHDRQAVRLVDTANAQGLYADNAEAPLLLLAPQALALEPRTSVALLMAEARALALCVAPSTTSLLVTIDLRGTFPEGIEENLRTWARSIGASDLGRAVGLAAFADNVTIQRTKEGVLARGSIAVADLVSGVRLLFFDGMREIFPAD